MKRRDVLPSLICVGLTGRQLLASPRGKQASAENHTAWVVTVLQRMQTIQPGMTREQLFRVFTTEGGISTGLGRRFVSRDCQYFKIDVEFKAVGRPDRDDAGRVTLVEDDRDVILNVSKPFLEYGICD